MKALTFNIELLEPLLATGLEGDPNSGVSQNYIAGSVLRGAIIGLYLRSIHKKKLDLTSDETKLFFNGSVNYLNCYPLAIVSNGDIRRSLPTPLAWQELKDKSEAEKFEFFNFSIKERGNKSYKNLGSPFFVFDIDDAFSNSDEIKAISPKKRLAVHINRSITGNTGGDNSSQVFRYESIDEKTRFCGIIISEFKTCLDEIKTLIENKKVNLGGSRTAGYGRAKFQNVEFVDDWKEPQVSFDTAIQAGNLFSITLLSNALVRDQNGHLQTDLTSELLGINATICEKKTFKRAEFVGGFNRKWGLPLPQQLSIRAGSVFTFKANQDISLSKIRELHLNGIGERKLDGFGRIAVNLYNKENELKWEELEETPIPKTFQSEFSDKMAIRILKQKLDAQLPKLINQNKVSGRISNSQISRLRLHIREVLRQPIITKEIAKQKIGEFFSQLKSTALNQFQSCSVRNVSNEKLDKWLINQFMNLDAFGMEKTITLGGETFSSNTLLVEYHLHLIDGILAQAAKEANK